MATLDLTVSYTLTSKLTGSSRLFAIPSTADSARPQMLEVKPGGGKPPLDAQFFLTETDLRPFYRIHTRHHGKSLALDVINSGDAANSTELRLSATSRYSAQYWRFDKWPGEAENAPYIYRITNNFTGLNGNLDVNPNTVFLPLVRSGGFTGQYWRLEVLKNDDGPTETTTTGGPGASQTTAGGTTSPAGLGGSTSDGGSSSGSGLSTGGIAGVVIGGIAAFAIIVGVVFFILTNMKKRRREMEVGGAMPSTPGQQQQYYGDYASYSDANGNGMMENKPPVLYGSGGEYAPHHPGMFLRPIELSSNHASVELPSTYTVPPAELAGGGAGMGTVPGPGTGMGTGGK